MSSEFDWTFDIEFQNDYQGILFGDVVIPFITSKDTSISKDVIEKNFVDEPPQVYELTSDLESGSYSIVLNEKIHAKNENFTEQKDAVLSMVSRHGTEFPFQSSGDNGYALVESANVTKFPSLQMREGTITVRFLDDRDYRSAVKATPYTPRNGDYDSESSPVESIVAFPSDLDIVNQTSDYTVSTKDGNIDLYRFTDKTIFEYDELEENYKSQYLAICRLFNSTDERLYSDRRIVDNGSQLTNSLVKEQYQSDQSTLEYYDGGWTEIGSTLLPFDDGFASVNENDEVEVTFVNGNKSSVYRGFSLTRFDFSGETSFEFEPTQSFTEQTVESYYSHYQDSNDYDIVVVREDSDGNFFDDGTVLGIQNLDSTKEYTVYVGVVPSSAPVSDYARYVYNFGNRERTFVQK